MAKRKSRRNSSPQSVTSFDGMSSPVATSVPKKSFVEVTSPAMLTHLQGRSGLVRTVMDGCHFCEESQDDWEKACDNMSLNPNCFLAQIEHSLMDSFMKSRMGQTTPAIRGYPTIIIIKHGKFQKLLNDRDSPSIVREAEKSSIAKPSLSPTRKTSKRSATKKKPKGRNRRKISLK
jgi:hypothetical protein